MHQWPSSKQHILNNQIVTGPSILKIPLLGGGKMVKAYPVPLSIIAH